MSMDMVHRLRDLAYKMATKGNADALREAADRLEVLERESAEYFESWHQERRKREALKLAMAEIAAHHEEQRDLWATEENGDECQARYHEERRNLALCHLTPNA